MYPEKGGASSTAWCSHSYRPFPVCVHSSPTTGTAEGVLRALNTSLYLYRTKIPFRSHEEADHSFVQNDSMGLFPQTINILLEITSTCQTGMVNLMMQLSCVSWTL